MEGDKNTSGPEPTGLESLAGSEVARPLTPPSPAKDAAGSAGPATSAPSPAASPTDLERFPEDPLTGEVTSIVVPDAPGERSPVPSISLGIEIERKLSSGGMGEVFLGVQKDLGRKVAVKRIRDLGNDPKAAERFVHEAKALALLHHPGIVQVYDFRQVRGEHYLIMEYVEGRTLDQVIQAEQKFAPDRIVKIAVQLTEALEAASHEGYIHRDLKPGNVMLADGDKAKIIDFGLAYKFRSLIKNRFTETGEIRGTPSFMSPEQVNEEDDLEVRSDIWSLGGLLYAMATGEPPFSGKDFVCTVKNVLLSEPTALTIIEKDFPPGLDQVIRKALRKDRSDRWQDYASFRYALLHYEEFSSGVPAGWSLPARGTAPAPVPPRRRTVVRLITIVLALALGALVWQVSRGSKEDRGGPAQDATHASLVPGTPTSANPGNPPRAIEPDPKPDPRESLKETKPERPAPGESTAKGERPAPPRLREKLFKWTPSDRAQAWVRQLLEMFSKHASELASYSFDETGRDLTALLETLKSLAPEESSPEEREYLTAHAEQAKALVGLAKNAVRARLEGLRPGTEIVTLRLRTGAPVSGSVVEGPPASITMKDAKANLRPIKIAEIAPEEFLSGASAPTAESALRALALAPAGALRSVIGLSDGSDELLLWIPVLLRLARLEVGRGAEEAASHAKTALLARTPLEGEAGLVESLARTDAAAKILAEEKAKILALYPYLASEFEIAAREKEALGLLANGAFSRILGGFEKTAAFPVAGQVLFRRFLDELAAASDELLADGAWYDYQWKIFPPVRDLPNPSDYVLPGYKERPFLFRDPTGLRKLVLGKIGLRVEEGVLINLSWKPLGTDLARSHWEFLLRGRERSENFLRVDERKLALCRSVLTPGANDIVLSGAALPASPVEKKYRSIALIPGDGHLHVFVDGAIALSLPLEDAIIPKQLSFHVYSGEAQIISMQAKKASKATEDRK